MLTPKQLRINTHLESSAVENTKVIRHFIDNLLKAISCEIIRVKHSLYSEVGHLLLSHYQPLSFFCRLFNTVYR